MVSVLEIMGGEGWTNLPVPAQGKTLDALTPVAEVAATALDVCCYGMTPGVRGLAPVDGRHRATFPYRGAMVRDYGTAAGGNVYFDEARVMFQVGSHSARTARCCL